MSNASGILTEPVNIVSSIPEGWDKRNLVDLCTPKQWKTISQNEMSKTGYPVFGANGFIGYYPEYNHENETIAITCRGATCGTVNLVPEKTYITGNSMCLDDVSRDTNVKYLYYASSYRTLSDVISGSAQPQITGESLRFVVLPIPPLPEQKKIASILTSVDEVIENTQRQIDKLQELKKATMNELLTKGIGHTEFKDSELGRIPKSWEVKRLGDIISEKPSYGANASASDRKNAYIRYVRITDIDDFGKLKSGSEAYIKTADAKDYLLSDNDLLIARTGNTVGKAYLHKKSQYHPESQHAYAGYLIRFRINPLLASPDYIFQFTLSEFFTKWVSENSRVGAQPNINSNEYCSFNVPIPPLNEQESILSVLFCLDERHSLFETKLAQTQSLKKSLMQDLLTGKVRVQV